MSKQRFDLNDEARQKINEQYEYADERVSASGGIDLTRKRQPSPVSDEAAAPRAKAKPKPDPKQKKPAVKKKSPVRRPSAAPAAPVIEPQPRPQPSGYPAEPPQDEPPGDDGNSRKSRLLRFYKRFAVVIIILGAIYIALNLAFLYYRGQLWFNEPRKRDYPVRGAVVTSELGKMDWEEFQYQPISFAYVRATKSTSFIDDQYADNRKGIDDSKLWAGFYHEFDFSSDGEKQAEHYIGTVGDLDGELRPAVKLTAYGAYKLRMKSAEKVKEQLDKFLKRIRQEYGRRAVIMCDNDCYDKYIKPYYSDQTIWMIDHFGKPDDDLDWALWEFNPRVRSVGYENKKNYYSVVVYRHGKDISNFRKNLEIGYE